MNEKRIIPVLRIFDEVKAKEFYISFLGFNADFEHRFQANFPLYMQISLGEWLIHLSEHHGDACPGASILLQMDNVRKYQELLLGKKYPYSRPGCQKTEWNTIEMAIADPFGNRLTFYENITDES